MLRPAIIANASIANAATDDERAYYSLSRRVYGSWFAAVYDTVCLPLRGLRSRVARLAGIRAGMRAIDIATGTGAQARAFAEAGASVVAIDLSPRMLSIAKRKHGDFDIEFVEGDATALHVHNASVDASCVSFALHEMPASVRARVVDEMARVTRPGGLVVIVDYALPRNRVWRWVVYHAIKLYERDHYADFIDSELSALLARSKISIHAEYRALLGVARVVICTRET